LISVQIFKNQPIQYNSIKLKHQQQINHKIQFQDVQAPSSADLRMPICHMHSVHISFVKYCHDVKERFDHWIIE
jgi:hypothetical protein